MHKSGEVEFKCILNIVSNSLGVMNSIAISDEFNCGKGVHFVQRIKILRFFGNNMSEIYEVIDSWSVSLCNTSLYCELHISAILIAATVLLYRLLLYHDGEFSMLVVFP